MRVQKDRDGGVVMRPRAYIEVHCLRADDGGVDEERSAGIAINEIVVMPPCFGIIQLSKAGLRDK